VLAVGDLLPLLLAWAGGGPYGFIGTPKSDYTWATPPPPGWPGQLWDLLADAYHRSKGSEWDPWEWALMDRPRCRLVAVRDGLTARGLRRHGVAALAAGNPMMDGLAQQSPPTWLDGDGQGPLLLLPGSRLPEALAHVVFLDALLIKPGDSALSVQSPEFADSIRKLQAAGNLAGNPPPAKILGIPEGDPLAAWVERRMTPQPLATLTQPLILKRGGADSLPRVYIECVRPGLFGEVNPFAQRARAEPGWTVATLETGHDAMVTAPEALTRLLVQVG
jgi:hypothetical protein